MVNRFVAVRGEASLASEYEGVRCYWAHLLISSAADKCVTDRVATFSFAFHYTEQCMKCRRVGWVCWYHFTSIVMAWLHVARKDEWFVYWDKRNPGLLLSIISDAKPRRNGPSMGRGGESDNCTFYGKFFLSYLFMETGSLSDVMKTPKTHYTNFD